MNCGSDQVSYSKTHTEIQDYCTQLKYIVELENMPDFPIVRFINIAWKRERAQVASCLARELPDFLYFGKCKRWKKRFKWYFINCLLKQLTHVLFQRALPLNVYFLHHLAIYSPSLLLTVALQDTMAEPSNRLKTKRSLTDFMIR